MNNAMLARVTAPFGQYCVAVHPSVMPLVFIQRTSGQMPSAARTSVKVPQFWPSAGIPAHNNTRPTTSIDFRIRFSLFYSIRRSVRQADTKTRRPAGHRAVNIR